MMDEIPAKVVYAVSAEVGLFIGMGIILFHSVRAVITATKNHSWGGFRSL